MKIGSHNTMSYLPPQKWYLWPFRFMARCQSKDLLEQIKIGAELFDLRFVFDEYGMPSFAHGLMKFKGNVENTLAWLECFSRKNISEGGQCFYVRVLNEHNTESSKKHFKQLCARIEKDYPALKFVGGENKKDWATLYDFHNELPLIKDKYSSCNWDTKKCTGWYLDDLWPRIYAMCFNKMWRKKNKDYSGFLLQDFIGVY